MFSDNEALINKNSLNFPSGKIHINSVFRHFTSTFVLSDVQNYTWIDKNYVICFVLFCYGFWGFFGNFFLFYMMVDRRHVTSGWLKWRHLQINSVFSHFATCSTFALSVQNLAAGAPWSSIRFFFQTGSYRHPANILWNLNHLSVGK